MLEKSKLKSMRYKIVETEKGNEIVLAGKVKNENLLITKINKISVELHTPKLVRFPYRDCRKVRNEFNRKSDYKIYVSRKYFPQSKISIEKFIKTKNIYFESRLRKYYDFLDDFIPHLDIYFSDIAGLSLSADQLSKRSLTELKTYLKWLKKSFFEKWKQYFPLKKFIALGKTPSLYKNLKLRNERRKLLIKLISEIIQSK